MLKSLFDFLAVVTIEVPVEPPKKRTKCFPPLWTNRNTKILFFNTTELIATIDLDTDYACNDAVQLDCSRCILSYNNESMELRKFEFGIDREVTARILWRRVDAQCFPWFPRYYGCNLMSIGRMVFAGSYNEKESEKPVFAIWDANNGDEAGVSKCGVPCSRKINAIIRLQNGCIVTGCKQIIKWSVYISVKRSSKTKKATLKQLCKIWSHCRCPVSKLCVTPDERVLLIGNEKCEVMVMDMESFAKLFVYDLRLEFTDLNVLLPLNDGKVIAVTSGGVIFVWDLDLSNAACSFNEFSKYKIDYDNDDGRGGNSKIDVHVNNNRNDAGGLGCGRCSSGVYDCDDGADDDDNYEDSEREYRHATYFNCYVVVVRQTSLQFAALLPNFEALKSGVESQNGQY